MKIWISDVRGKDGPFAELVEAQLHLRNASQLGLHALLFLGEGETRGGVQLLEAPAALPIKLQQVRVVLPVGRKNGALPRKWFIC